MTTRKEQLNCLISLFFMCRHMGEYISLELFDFVNLTSGCSLITFKTTVKQSKMRWGAKPLIRFLLSYVVFVPSARTRTVFYAWPSCDGCELCSAWLWKKDKRSSHFSVRHP